LKNKGLDKESEESRDSQWKYDQDKNQSGYLIGKRIFLVD